MFPKLNETAIEMLQRNNEPETALDILKQALNELKLSKAANSKDLSINNPFLSSISNPKRAANKVNQTHPKSTLPNTKVLTSKHNLTPLTNSSKKARISSPDNDAKEMYNDQEEDLVANKQQTKGRSKGNNVV